MLEVNIWIVSHGKFCEEILSSAEMIIGRCDMVKTFPLLPGVSGKDFLGCMKSEFQKISGQRLIILADLYGGTPCNMASYFLRENNVEVIAGINLPMLLGVIEAIQDENLEGSLSERVVNIGKDQIKQVSL